MSVSRAFEGVLWGVRCFKGASGLFKWRLMAVHDFKIFSECFKESYNMFLTCLPISPLTLTIPTSENP